MIEQILKDINIKQIARLTTKNNHYQDDLHQEITLEVLQMNKTKLIRLHKENDLSRYVYRMAYIMYNGGSFYRQYRKPYEVIPNDDVSITLKEVTDGADLTEMERIWIKLYLDHECNSSWMQSNVNISRRHIKKEINRIIDKCKKQLTY